MLVLVQVYLGEAFLEGVEETPVGGRFLAIEQAGLGQPEHPGGFAAEYRAARVLFAQPGQDLGITLAEGGEIIPEGRQDDDVGIFQSAVHRHDHVAEAVHRFAIGADQPGFKRRGQAVAQLFAIAQAGQVEKILGLHEGGGEDPVDCQDADAPQGRGGVHRHSSSLFL
ncbi:hypothetical protein D3C76_1031700 [compost metagenome]